MMLTVFILLLLTALVATDDGASGDEDSQKNAVARARPAAARPSPAFRTK